MIYLHTIGDALIKVGDKDIRPTSPLLFAALLYLCIERGRRVPRTALQELLFPNSNERSGAHSLRQLLYKLRQLGVPIQVNDDTVRISREDVTQEDLECIGLFSETETAGSVRRDVLPAYAGLESAPYQEWLAGTRSTIEARMRSRLVDAISQGRAAGRWAYVESLARALLSIDALNEQATVALAEALALTGSKAKALRLIDAYQLEVGENNSASVTSVLRRRIAKRPSSVNDAHRESSLYGRASELADLNDVMQEVLRGSPRALVLSGDAGIGKTRLVQEFERVVTLNGVRVEWCQCAEYAMERPSAALSQTVGTLLGRPGALGVSPAAMELLKRLTETSSRDIWPTPTDADALRSAVAEAVRDLVQAIAEESPLVLVVEDAHWIDASSLSSLLTLVNDHKTVRLFLIFNTRDATLVRHQNRHSRLRSHHLRPISDAAATQTVIESLGASDDTELLSWAVRVAGGNPFFLRAIAHYYKSTGQRFAVPSSVKVLIRQSLAGLQDTSRRVLEVAAVLGRSSSLARLRRILSMTRRELMPALRDLENRGLMKQRDSWVGVAHDLLLEDVVASIPPASSRLLHGIVAEVLDEEARATRNPDLMWECAEHWKSSGEVHRAVDLVLACAQHLINIGEPSAAYELALRARTKDLDPTASAQLTRTAAVAAFGAFMTDAARRHVDEIRSGPAAFRDSSVDAADLDLLEIELDRLDGRNCAHHVTRLLEVLHDSRLRARQRLNAAFLLLAYADATYDRPLAERTMLAVDGVDTTDTNARLFACTCSLIFDVTFGDPTRVPSHIAALESVIALHPAAVTLRHRANCGIACYRCGMTNEAIERFSELYEVATSLSSATTALTAACELATVYGILGDPAEAQWMRTAEELSSRLEHAPNIWLVLEQRFSDRLELGDVAGARDVLLKLPAATHPHGDIMPTRLTTVFAALDLRLAVAEDDLTRVHHWCDKLLASHERAVRCGLYDEIMEALCAGLNAVGQDGRARTLLDKYLANERRDGFPPGAALLRYQSHRAA